MPEYCAGGALLKDYAKRVILPEMQRTDPDTDISIETRAEIPGLNTTEADQVSHLAQALSRNKSTAKVAYTTEGGLFQRAGIPAMWRSTPKRVPTPSK